MFMYLFFIIIIFVTTSNPLLAIETGDSEWKNVAELGIFASVGNTKSKTMSGNLSVTNERKKSRHHMKITAFNASGEDSSGVDRTTAESYSFYGKSGFKYSEKHNVFVTIQYEQDRFSGLNYRLTETIGYGNRIIDKENMLFDIEGGAGSRQSEPKTGHLLEEFLFRVTGYFKVKLTENITLTENLTSDFGDGSTITKSTTSLSTQVIGNLAMKLSLNLKRTSDVPEGIKKNDADSTLTLAYDF